MKREEIILDEIIERLKKYRRGLYGYQVFLFGSRASGKSGDRSDFDVGVYGSRPLPLELFYQIEDEFDDIPTLFTIDWVDFSRVSESFRNNAMKHQVILYGQT